eukprot:TRINITY_DN9070_c0_g2_i2.p1 TRINITY_DN9070_c0_g2~~TRINITY_DN9070_c0_g2_i2.p1  ORF type:complete len:302 (+),score=37.33 TRINITY_DN9070_c0_g2_i2:92-997(+)
MNEEASIRYFKEHGVHGLIDSMLGAAVKEKPDDIKAFWREWLGRDMLNDYQFKALIFDLDGCITKTAEVHSRAWKSMFDAYLKDECEGDHTEFTSQDYLKFVDGKPRYQGVKSFLDSRGISLPFGDPSDLPSKQPITMCSLGNRKNDYFVKVLKTEGVTEYPSSVRLIKQAREIGIRVGVASSSKNAKHVLESAGLSHLIEERIDGVVSAEMGLKGKPAGDIFVTCCKKLGCLPHEAIVIEDATSGVAAGRDGKFRLVIGLAREENIRELRDAGAHIAVEDFGNATLKTLNTWFTQQPVPE